MSSRNETLSQQFADMVFLNESLGEKVVALDRDIEEFKRSVTAQLSAQLSELAARIRLLEQGHKPDRIYVLDN
jgi:hypothetical protein